MLDLSNDTEVFVCVDPIDMRKQINGLVALVIDEFSLPPQANQVYVFVSRDRRKVKMLHWHGNGFVLLYKRLEQDKFIWPRQVDASNISINYNQLQWLLAGLDFYRMQQFPQISYTHYY